MISNRRILTFLFGCILVRSILVYLAYYLQKNKKTFFLNLHISICFLIGLSMILIYFGINKENADKQLQVWEDDDPVLWWNDLRILHGSLYIIFSILTAFGIENTWIILLLDTIIGLCAWAIHHKFI
jgi:hypothetical protein